MISTRPAGLNDLPLIQELARQIWPVTFLHILSEDQIEYMLNMMYSSSSLHEQIINQQHHFILVQYQNNDVGYASYQNHYKGLKATKIHKIYIHPSFQQKGIGKYLINSIAEKAIRQHDQSLLLNVNKNNDALDFYKKNGFKVVAEEIIPIGNNFVMDDYVMEKDLFPTLDVSS